MRVPSIKAAADAVIEANRALSEEIHRVYAPGTEVDYQIGFSEHPSSWQRYVVVRPHSPMLIVIRNMEIGKTEIVDGRDYRLRLPGTYKPAERAA